MKKEWYAVIYNEYSIEYGVEPLGSLTEKQKKECLAAIQEVAKIRHLYSIEGYGVTDLDDNPHLTKEEILAATKEATRISKEQIKILSKTEYEKIPLQRRALFRYERAHRGDQMDSEKAGIGLLQFCVYMAKELRGDEPSMSELLKQASYHNYEIGLLLKYADKVDEWHIVSKTKYNGKGWADMAKVELEKQVEDGKRKNYKQSDVDKLGNYPVDYPAARVA